MTLLAPGGINVGPVGATDQEFKNMDALSSKREWLMRESNSDNGDIAKAAKAYLQSEGAKVFTPQEQQELINEGDGQVLARNFDTLNIQGTHYELVEAALQAEEDDLELW